MEAKPGQKCACVDHSGQTERAAASDLYVGSSFFCCDLFADVSNMVCLVFDVFLSSGDFRCNTLLSLDLWFFACPRYTRVTPRVLCHPIRRHIRHYLRIEVIQHVFRLGVSKGCRSEKVPFGVCVAS